MKFLTTLALFCASIFISPIFSQGPSLSSLDLKGDKSKISNPHQIGLSIGNGGLGGLITYRYEFSKNNIFRASYNGGGLKEIVSGNKNNSPYPISVDLGYERHIPISKKLSAYVGVETGLVIMIKEGMPLYERTKIDALAGLKYKVNKRISLFAEARYGVAFTSYNIEGGTLRTSSWGPEIHGGILFTLGKFKNKK